MPPISRRYFMFSALLTGALPEALVTSVSGGIWRDERTFTPYDLDIQ